MQDCQFRLWKVKIHLPQNLSTLIRVQNNYLINYFYANYVTIENKEVGAKKQSHGTAGIVDQYNKLTCLISLLRVGPQ